MTSIDKEISKMYKSAESIHMLSNEGVYQAMHHDSFTLVDFTLSDILRYKLIAKQENRLRTSIRKIEKDLLKGNVL